MLCPFSHDWSVDLWSGGVILYGEWLNVVHLHAWLVCWPVVRCSYLIWWVNELYVPSPSIVLSTCGQLESCCMMSNWTLCSFTNDWSINLWSVGVMLYGEWLNDVLLQPWFVCWPVVRWSHVVSWVSEHCTPSCMIGLLTSGQLEPSCMVCDWTLYSFTDGWSVDLWSVGVILYGE